MIVKKTIQEMIKSLPPGGDVTFPKSTFVEGGRERFYSIWTNYEYSKPEFLWENQPEIKRLPRAASRLMRGVDFSDLPPCVLKFRGNKERLADIYLIGQGPAFVSEKLFLILQEFDSDSISWRREMVLTKNGWVDCYMIIPQRILSAIDIHRTTIRIYDDNLAGEFFRYLEFVEGAYFVDLDREVNSFWDYDFINWMWSDEILARCRADGIRGLLAKRTGGEIRGVEYRL
ncbi:imm11 family protein [Caulobacter flavus]|uniref:imm11 family protein n=1 Tax=Caulobacter flavus TaxID=1679497 RepID=UPI0011AFAB7D|nr:DUF1629 domain-containing protein [Caulobacter flavus]